MENKDYIAVVQCHLVKQCCSGYFCEKVLKELIGKLKLDICETASISKKAEKRRQEGIHKT